MDYQNRRNQNPRNSGSELFRKLTRLLSGPIVNYRAQTERNLSRRKVDKYRFRSASGQQFKKSTYNPLDHLQAEILANQGRSERYADFNQMEYTPEIAAAIDIYAEEMTTSTEICSLLKIDCHNHEIKSILETLYTNVLNLEFNLFGWCRTMCKFGDLFLYLDIDEERGITNAIGLPTHEIERLEALDKTNPNYVQFQWNSGGMTFENWQVAHFRILGNDKFAPYGTSVLDAARRIWRQLILLEDAMMAYRIVRSPERRVFYIDVGNIPVNEVEQYMQKVVTQMKRNQVVDNQTGRVDLRYNPLSIEEDYYIPTRAGASSKIETLPGGTYTGDVDDVKYLRDKLFSALKIPAAYLSNSSESMEDKNNLAQKDIRFARTIQRLQRSVVTELEKIGIVHLYILGYRAKDLVSFKLSLGNPSKIAAMQELEHWRLKFEIASSATEGFFSRNWVSKNIFNLSDEEIIKNQREMFFDRKFESALEASSEAVSEEAAGALGAVGEEFEEIPEEEPIEGAEEEFAEEEAPELEGAEDVILAEPAGKRDEPTRKIRKDVFGKIKQSITQGAKGKWYKPVTNDGRKTFGPRSKNIKQQWSHEKTRSTPRTYAPGGITPLKRAVIGLTEGKDTIYNDEETELFRINGEIENLISQMEQKDEA